jgi:hypothetical protein
MTQDEIIEMAKEAGLHVANDSEGHFSGVTNEEMIDMYPDPNKERDRLFREKIFIEVLAPFAKLVAAKEREACVELIKSHGPTLANGFMLTEAIRARGEAWTS